jgi:GNAT superfamily N-acetyltransferase
MVVFSGMKPEDFEGVVLLQRLCFPIPFDQDILWQTEHLARHLELFHQGQFVAQNDDDMIIGSCTNSIISSELVDKHGTWDETVGGVFLSTFDRKGDVLFGVDISVHPDYRRRSIGRVFYEQRKQIVGQLGLSRFATTCRMPDFETSGCSNPTDYGQKVAAGQASDRTLTPLLRYGLTMTAVLEDHIDDPE